MKKNYFKQQFSHIPPQFQFNGNFKQYAWVEKKILLCVNQLKSFVHLRINLSPFTKDFRVRETPIEKLNYLSSFLRGSNLGSFEAKAKTQGTRKMSILIFNNYIPTYICICFEHLYARNGAKIRLRFAI